jgi:hypothetical protein
MPRTILGLYISWLLLTVYIALKYTTLPTLISKKGPLYELCTRTSVQFITRSYNRMVLLTGRE